MAKAFLAPISADFQISILVVAALLAASPAVAQSHDESVTMSKNSTAYVHCVLDAAANYAKDATLAPGDIADASISACASAYDSFELAAEIVDIEIFKSSGSSDPNGLENAEQSAHGLANGIRTDLRGDAIRIVIKVRQNQSASTADPITRAFIDGTSAYKRGDYTTAMRLFRPLADESNSSVQPAAQLMLGHLYENGYGVQKDDAEAAKWYRRAANQGDAVAQLKLGLAYYFGWGVARNYSEAAKWYQMAADQGDAHAQSQLGQLYDRGEGVPKDDAEAAKWYRKAADQGNAMAQLSLGNLYDGGDGVPQDDVQAYVWLKLSTAGVPASDMDSDLNDAIMKAANGVLHFLVPQMTAAQIAEARQLAANWKPSHSGEPQPDNSSMTGRGGGGPPIAATSGVTEPASIQNTTCTKQEVELARWAKQNGYQYNSSCH